MIFSPGEDVGAGALHSTFLRPRLLPVKRTGGTGSSLRDVHLDVPSQEYLMPQPPNLPPAPPNHGIVFFVDQEKFVSPTETLTVRQILADYAEEDPASTTLVEKQGQVQHANLDEVIDLKNGMKFIVYHNTPTTVS